MKSIDRVIWEKCYNFSKQLARVSHELDLSFTITPLNRSLERGKFFQNVEQGKEYNPTFTYSPLKIGTRKLQKAVEAIFSENEFRSLKEIGLVCTLEKLRGYLDKKIELLRAIGTPEFSGHSVSLYGRPDKFCLKVALRILEGSAVKCEETVTAEAIKEALEEEIRKFNLGRIDCSSQKHRSGFCLWPKADAEPPFAKQGGARNKSIFLDWKVRIVDNTTTKVSVSSFNKEVLVNRRLKFTPFEAERLKVHEIDIHVLRAENGSRQPLAIFQTGLGGYQETEEGLSVYFEEKTGNLDKLQERLYAARALGAALALEGSFFSVFNELAQYLPAELAYRITERVKRGISDTSQKGGFSKDYYYISGREKVREYLKRGGDIRILFVGKIGLDDVGLAKKLLDRGILNRPAILPNFINN